MFFEVICSSIICQRWSMAFQDRRRFIFCNPSEHCQATITFNSFYSCFPPSLPLSIYLSIYLSLSTYLSFYLSILLSIFCIKSAYLPGLLFSHGVGVWVLMVRNDWILYGKQWRKCEGCHRHCLFLPGKCRKMPCQESWDDCWEIEVLGPWQGPISSAPRSPNLCWD